MTNEPAGQGPVDQKVGPLAQGAHPVLAAISAIDAAEARPAALPALAGPGGNCERSVSMGCAFVYGQRVYCTTDGCTLSAYWGKPGTSEPVT